jgi:hypothetical protein
MTVSRITRIDKQRSQNGTAWDMHVLLRDQPAVEHPLARKY